jgi:putative transposase
MIRTYRYLLKPSRRQQAVLVEWLERCRVLYNVGLEQRREWWRMGKGLNYMGQTKELTDLRAADSRYGQMPALVCRSPLRQLQRAFEGFFRRLRRGDKPGYPRFKGRGRFDSFGIGRVSVEGRKVRIPKLGLIKFWKYRDLGGEILDARVMHRAGRWQVAFACDLGPAPEKPPARSAVGLDVGLSSFATLSDGTKVENPRFFRKGEDLLARRQRRLSRTRRDSMGRARARLLVQKAHEHVRNQRLDFARKLAAELFRKYDCVFHEDLNLHGLSRSPLAKSVQDAAWGVFLRALIGRAECAGRWAVGVDPRGTSVRCSGCGASVPKELSDRIHRCFACKLEMDRDENAARNILAFGRNAADVLGQSPSS